MKKINVRTVPSKAVYKPYNVGSVTVFYQV